MRIQIVEEPVSPPPARKRRRFLSWFSVGFLIGGSLALLFPGRWAPDTPLWARALINGLGGGIAFWFWSLDWLRTGDRK